MNIKIKRISIHLHSSKHIYTPLTPGQLWELEQVELVFSDLYLSKERSSLGDRCRPHSWLVREARPRLESAGLQSSLLPCTTPAPFQRPSRGEGWPAPKELASSRDGLPGSFSLLSRWRCSLRKHMSALSLGVALLGSLVLAATFSSLSGH